MSDGISPELLKRMKKVLQTIDHFRNDDVLRTVFTDDRINQWKNSLPSASSIEERVQFAIGYLYKQKDKGAKNGLVLFLSTLADLYSQDDANHSALIGIASQLEAEILVNQTPIIEFVNRTQELSEISRSTLLQQYWVIDGPAGYGKTIFLNEIQRRYKEQGWVCVYLQILKGKHTDIIQIADQILQQMGVGLGDTSDVTIEAMGEEIGANLLSLPLSDENHQDISLAGAFFKGGAILIDNIEMLDNSTLLNLADMINAVHLYLRKSTIFFTNHNRLRFFLAGRDARRKCTVFRSKGFPYESFSLSPYAFPYVQETVRLYAQKAGIALNEDNLLKISADLMYLTGGHPGFIAELLRKLTDSRFTRANTILRQYTEEFSIHFNSLLKDLVEFDKDMPALIETLEILCVFRRFPPWLLKGLINCGLLTWGGDNDKLEQILTGTYLLKRDSGFLQDSITQRLFAIHLRQNDIDRFKKLCQAGLQMYKDRLSREFSQYPVQLTIEYFGLKLQYDYHASGLRRTELKKSILDTLNENIAILVSKLEEDDDVLTDFLTLLEQDWELEFFVNYFLSENFYQPDIYQYLIKQVRENCRKCPEVETELFN